MADGRLSPCLVSANINLTNTPVIRTTRTNQNRVGGLLWLAAKASSPATNMADIQATRKSCGTLACSACQVWLQKILVAEENIGQWPKTKTMYRGSRRNRSMSRRKPRLKKVHHCYLGGMVGTGEVFGSEDESQGSLSTYFLFYSEMTLYHNHDRSFWF